MARQQPVLDDESLHIPAAAFSFAGFRKWAQSESFPDAGRIDYLAGDVEVEMSPEELRTHSLVKTAFALGLGNLLVERQIGNLFIDKARLSSSAANLSVEPDLVVVLWESIDAGRVVFRSWSQSHPERLTEIEGAADLVVEIVSDSSVGKDTKTLPRLYARAGIPELWIADARGRHLRFRILTLRESAYVSVEPDQEGWLRSPRLGADFRLVRKASPFTGWDYTLERRG